MPQLTPNIGLKLFDRIADKPDKFIDYRDAMAGTGATSNANIIDDEIGAIKVDINTVKGGGWTSQTIKGNTDAIALLREIGVTSITTSGSNALTATATEFASAPPARSIFLMMPSALNTTNVTLSINSETAKPINKARGRSGTIVLDALEAGDLRPNVPVFVRKSNDGTRYVLVNFGEEFARNVFYDTGGGVFITAQSAIASKANLNGGNAFTGNQTINGLPPILATTASITYYVRNDGSNSNTGLSDGVGGAFRTIQRAIDVLPKYLAHDVIINVRAGAYVENVEIRNFSGGGAIRIIGDTIVSTSRSVNRIHAYDSAIRIYLEGLNMTSTTEAWTLYAYNVSYFSVSLVNLISNAPTVDGVRVVLSEAEVVNSVISNKRATIVSSTGARIRVTSCTGVDNLNALIAEAGGIISKDGTQPVGVTQELSISGGIIIGDQLVTTITTGFASGWSGTITVRKGLGNLCQTTFSFEKTSDITIEAIYTLPIGLRPLTNIFVTGTVYTSGGGIIHSNVELSIQTNGIVSVYNGGASLNARMLYNVNFVYYSA